MISGWSCEVCGGPQKADEEGRIIESTCDVRFHLLLERIEKLEAAMAAVRKESDA